VRPVKRKKLKVAILADAIGKSDFPGRSPFADFADNNDWD
jgi:hypothetical protein